MKQSLVEQTDKVLEGRDWFVREATLEDARTLLPNLRAADRAEIEAITGQEVNLPLLEFCFLSSALKFVGITEKDGIVAAFGVANLDEESEPNGGSIWCIGTDAITTNPFPFLRASKAMLHKMEAHYDYLANFVHSCNTVHIRWLKWLGFTFLNRTRFGKHEFFEFAKLCSA